MLSMLNISVVIHVQENQKTTPGGPVVMNYIIKKSVKPAIAI
jgi:hypothetical protein